jgi:hypothetical protein
MSAYRRGVTPKRNDPCPCGSGKKYKRCCLELDEARPPRAERDAEGRLIARPDIQTSWQAQGKRVRAVGSAITFRPPNETDHEFYISVLADTLGGKQWADEQRALPEDRRHVALGWIDHWDALRRGDVEGIDRARTSPTTMSAAASGDLMALGTLAYDIYTLRHASVLPDALAHRIRTPGEFQGARYEVAVAAVFARSGYNLEWITAKDRKLPEFIARHVTTKTEIAVEAKSRHRPGVLGRAGEPLDAEVLGIDVARLMRRAVVKETDGRPFVICIDLNLPTTRVRTQAEWIQELHDNVLAEFGNDVTGQPVVFSAAFFTNFAWHWEGDKQPGYGSQFGVLPDRPEVPLPPGELKLLDEALAQYAFLPGSLFQRPEAA